jgi:hypothetical protein
MTKKHEQRQRQQRDSCLFADAQTLLQQQQRQTQAFRRILNER